MVFNGEIKTVSDIEEFDKSYDTVNAIMIGRGLIANPEISLWYKNNYEKDHYDTAKFKEFHNSLLEQYIDVLSGDKPVLHRMKEFWAYWQVNFPDKEKELKKIRKSNKLFEYKDLITSVLK